MDKEAEKLAKMVWNMYLKENDPPEGVPRDPEKEYGEDFKGWMHFLWSIRHHFPDKKKK